MEKTIRTREEESEAEKAASEITNKFHNLIRRIIWQK